MEGKKPNSLINETSPYLLQHAYNPVNWYPWNEDTLKLAKKEDKPIFLSIGYSACHWCHVMAHESFEDKDIAKIMNDKFVNIKVDREERPDIDDVYQQACQIVNGNGGWPLSVFLTPDLKPFYVGTYFPKNSRYGMPGFGEILSQLDNAYHFRKNEINSTTSDFMNALEDSSKNHSINKDLEIDKSVLDESALNLLNIADYSYGGFGTAPKFPNVSNLLFLLRYYDISNIEKFRDFVILTSEKILYGGIHDHLGGGFCRYSTDQKWLVPHFEKMLYDNSLLVILFSEVYQITKDVKFKIAVEKTLGYILRELLNQDGGFFSAQDADSEGEEGKYYLWTKKEVSSLIENPLHLNIFCEYYNISEGGNFEGKNILNIKYSYQFLSKKYGLDIDEIKSIIDESSLKLFNFREKRTKPQKDDKTILSWNALAISSFIKGYRITGNKTYLKTAKDAINFIENKMKLTNDSLYRIYKNDVSKIPAYLDDYSFYVNALLDLLEINPNIEYLNMIINYTDHLIKNFWDSNENNFYYTSSFHESLPIRNKILYDLAIPSGNSISISNFIRLYHVTGNRDYIDFAERMMKSSLSSAVENPFGFGCLLSSAYMYIKKPVEITVFTKNVHIKKTPLLDFINTAFIPNGIFSIIDNECNLKSLEEYALFQNKSSLDRNDDEFVLICKDFTCSPPIKDIEGIKDILFSKLSKERIK
ncbi:MAG TPA: thioredoxin domain-containing protein [Candidatus Nitrosocosmicus sp.]|nr:thioredoxin domain-containing protein [Candidatus Nitrosocosmicus sp.]